MPEGARQDSFRAALTGIMAVAQRLAAVRYLADEGLATALYLALRLPQPLLLEGEPGVGKSELARALAAAYGLPFLRLQCYEGLESHEALYEWNHLAQLLLLHTPRGEEPPPHPFDRRFLLPRALLSALEESQELPAVLLIDELDRADEAFEAFLLEFLADFAITVPEYGRIAAGVPPVVLITSNRTRELHDALKRRCLYHWIDYPDEETERAIVQLRAPHLPAEVVAQVVHEVARLRAGGLWKPPGIAESVAWAEALAELAAAGVGDDALRQSIGVVVKSRDDLERARAVLSRHA